jgi:hypothetical protein
MIEEAEFRQKIADFDSILIKTSAVAYAFEGLEKLLKYGGTRGGARFMLLSGDSRSGKSHIARAFEQRYPREHLNGRTRAPVVYVELQGKTTESGTPSQILRALGDVAPAKGTIEEKHSRIITHIRDLGVRLLIVDEAHHLVERKPGQQNRLYAASEWFKFILNNSGCSMVFAGLPVIKSIVDVNPQFAQRTVKGAELPAYDHALDKPRREYAKVVRQLCQEAPIQVAPHLLDDRGISRFHLATRGLVGNMWELLRWAAINAYHDNHDTIDLKVLAKTYQELGVSQWTRHNFFMVR